MGRTCICISLSPGHRWRRLWTAGKKKDTSSAVWSSDCSWKNAASLLGANWIGLKWSGRPTTAIYKINTYKKIQICFENNIYKFLTLNNLCVILFPFQFTWFCWLYRIEKMSRHLVFNKLYKLLSFLLSYTVFLQILLLLYIVGAEKNKQYYFYYLGKITSSRISPLLRQF